MLYPQCTLRLQILNTFVWCSRSWMSVCCIHKGPHEVGVASPCMGRHCAGQGGQHLCMGRSPCKGHGYYRDHNHCNTIKHTSWKSVQYIIYIMTCNIGNRCTRDYCYCSSINKNKINKQASKLEYLSCSRLAPSSYYLGANQQFSVAILM